MPLARLLEIRESAHPRSCKPAVRCAGLGPVNSIGAPFHE